MSEEAKELAGPDFTKGVPNADLAEGGMILGQVAGEAVLLARSASPVRKLKQAWCHGQRTVSATSTPSASGPW